jgi:hypothetical protein
LLNSGYNPPKFVIDAAKEALNKVDCNQYSPTKARLQRKRIAFVDRQTHGKSRGDHG